MKPKKLIFKNGKRVLVDFDEVSNSETNKAYNNKRQSDNPEYVDFYHSKEWRLLRQEALTRDYETCVRCGERGTLVDHIIPSKDDWNNRLDINNLQTLCMKCHQIKTRREWLKKHKGVKRDMKVHVISGYPASGKSSYVANKIKGTHDLVFDYDLLMSSLNGNLIRSLNVNNRIAIDSIQHNIHEQNIDINEYVELIYEMITRKLLSEKTFENVWIIRTFPDERLNNIISLSGLDVEFLILQTSKATCTERILKQGRDVKNAKEVMSKIDRLYDEGMFEHYKIIKN